MRFIHLRVPYFYEPDIPDDYTEKGVEKGAKLNKYKVTHPDVLRILTETRALSLQDALSWIDQHQQEFDFSTVIVDTDDGKKLEVYARRKPKLFVEKRSLNEIRHLNTLLNKANESLDEGGYLWCHCRTAALKRWTIMERYPQKRTPVDWAFRFVGDYPEVATILSGMSDEQQLEDNLRIFKHVRVGGLSDADKRLIARLRAGYKRRMPIGCTGCAYCQPCPQGVAIPDIFDLYNFSCMYDDANRLHRRYTGMVEKECDASRCVQCGMCEDQCPQHLPIREWLQTVDAAATK